MKKLLILCLLLTVLLCGCALGADVSEAGYETIVPGAGDFTFAVPDGYSTKDITDYSCTLVRDEDAAVVGGIEVTALTQNALTEDHAKSIMLYLQDKFHKTNDVEYITSHWGDDDLIVTVHLRKHEDDGTQRMYYHIFFEEDSRVYHLWVDEDVTGEDDANDFICVTDVD